MLIGAVALIVFGPRKLPQLAKTLGKTIADFKNTTNEFKTTWEREVNFEEVNSVKDTAVLTTVNRKHELVSSVSEPDTVIVAPEIKEVDAAQFNLKPTAKVHPENQSAEKKVPDKMSWL